MFMKRWRQHKPPELQRSIFKLIVISGSSSKKKFAETLQTNYSDISHSMKALEKRNPSDFPKALPFTFIGI